MQDEDCWKVEDEYQLVIFLADDNQLKKKTNKPENIFWKMTKYILVINIGSNGTSIVADTQNKMYWKED